MLRWMRTTLCLCASLLATTALFAAPARADGIVLPEVSILAGIDGNTNGQMTITSAMLQSQIDLGNATAVQNADGSVTISGGTFTMSNMWQLELTTLTLDADPFVNFVGGFQNLSGVAQDFILSTALTVVPVLPASLIGGSTSLTYGDANFDGLGGLTNATSGGSGYSGTIDGANALDMLNAFSLAPLFPGDTTQVVTQALGLPGPTLPGPAALTGIGITHRFNLSGLDQVTFNSTFIVVPVPEPGTGLLLGLGIAGLAVTRRRSQG